MTTIVYSTTRVPADLRPEGARYLNPGFFTGCERGASLVYLNGDFPKVRAAYERAGVSVVDLRARAAPVAPLAAPEGKVEVSKLAPEALMALAGPLPHQSIFDIVKLPDDLPALADLPEAEQAEVEAVLNDDTPFDGMTDEPDAS